MANTDQQQCRRIYRMLFMVDIHIFHSSSNTNPRLNYLAITDAAEKLIRACKKSNSNHGNGDDVETLWSFKFFDSALSPFKSRSFIEPCLGKPAVRSGFGSFSESQVFFKALKASAKILHSLPCNSSKWSADSVAKSMQELLFDYAWDPPIVDGDTSDRDSSLGFNLVLLFSALPRSRDGLLEFAKRETDELDDLLRRFAGSYRSLSDSFKCRDVHVCWIDFPQAGELSAELWSRALGKIGWQYVSVDTVVAGSRLVPMGLIWRDVAYPVNCLPGSSGKVDLVLELADVDGKPIFCKASELQCFASEQSRCLGSKVSSKDDGSSMPPPKCCGIYWKRVNITGVFEKEKFPDFSELVAYTITLAGFSNKKRKKRDDAMNDCGNLGKEDMRQAKDSDLIGDEILKKLKCKEEFEFGKPAWPLLLVFLERKNSFALVKISDVDDASFCAVLQPLSVHRAVLYVLRMGISIIVGPSACENHDQGLSRNDCSRASEAETSANKDVELQVVPESQESMELQAFPESQESKESVESTCELIYARRESQCGASPTPFSSKYLKMNGYSKCSNWALFYSWVLRILSKSGPDVDSYIFLENRYFKGICQKSKILKFLECWMKKMSKNLVTALQLSILQKASEYNESQVIDVNQQKLVLDSDENQESEGLDVGKHALTLDSKETSYTLVQNGKTNLSLDEAALFSVKHLTKSVELLPLTNGVSDLEASTFCNPSGTDSLEEKIQHGLSSREVDLQALVKLVVTLVIEQAAATTVIPDSVSADSDTKVENVSEQPGYEDVLQTILKKPKKLKDKYRNCLPPIPGQEQIGISEVPPVYSSEDKVREHELQILLRLEILASRIAESNVNQMKSKLTEEICSLLDNIQFNLSGGIFGGESLLEFADRVIVSRYGGSLKEVIDYIYKKMEFHPLYEYDFTAHLTSDEKSFEMDHKESHESSQGIGYINADEMSSEQDRDAQISESSKNDIESSHDLKNEHEPLKFQDDYERKLKKAQEKRERAWRFAHFTSKARDLQRVWAPKRPIYNLKHQPKADKKKLSKKRRKLIDDYVVLETPMNAPKMRRLDDKKIANLDCQTKVGADVVHETPYFQAGIASNASMKDHNISLTSRCLLISDNDSGLQKSVDHTSDKESKVSSVSRTLFEV